MDFSPFAEVRSSSILQLGLSISIHGMTIIYGEKGRAGGRQRRPIEENLCDVGKVRGANREEKEKRDNMKARKGEYG